MIPQKTAPLIFFFDIAPIAMRAAMVMSRGIISAHVVWPKIMLNECRSTSVESLLTTIPEF